MKESSSIAASSKGEDRGMAKKDQLCNKKEHKTKIHEREGEESKY